MPPEATANVADRLAAEPVVFWLNVGQVNVPVLKSPDCGVPKIGVVNDGLVASTTAPVPVEVVAPVPPLPTAKVPLTCVVKPILPYNGATPIPPEMRALPVATSASFAQVFAADPYSRSPVVTVFCPVPPLVAAKVPVMSDVLMSMSSQDGAVAAEPVPTDTKYFRVAVILPVNVANVLAADEYSVSPVAYVVMLVPPFPMGKVPDTSVPKATDPHEGAPEALPCRTWEEVPASVVAIAVVVEP